MRALRVLVVIVVSGFLLPVSAPAATAADYDAVVDITFPTSVGARYGDDFAQHRGGGRRHRATDLVTAAGEPVFAAFAGTVVWITESEHGSAGFGLQVRGEDDRLYAYYHLGPAGGDRSQALAAGLRKGSRIERAQHLGYVGDSGNARGTPHLHFEIHDAAVTDPFGGNRRNPYGSLRAAERRGDYADATAQRPSRTADREQPTTAAPREDSRPPVLRRGDRGPAVRRWQSDLNRVRRSPITVDGVFGSGTHAATRAFQRSASLTPDGIVGRSTRVAMARAQQQNGDASRGNGAPTDEPVLRRGDRGPAVRAWQRDLNGVGKAKLTVDGVFGTATQRATTAFQRSQGLKADGVVGRATRAAMRSASG